MESMRGNLLVAAPSQFDFFRRTVILVIEHTDQGAFGVVLNRPSETTVSEAISELGGLAGPEEPVWIGGPVGSDSVILLGELDDPDGSPRRIVERVGVVDPESPGPLGRVRVFAGHAGWSAGQLDEELEREAWLVEPAEPEDVFAGEDAWAAVTGRMEGREMALLGSMPMDPSLN